MQSPVRRRAVYAKENMGAKTGPSGTWRDMDCDWWVAREWELRFERGRGFRCLLLLDCLIRKLNILGVCVYDR